MQTRIRIHRSKRAPQGRKASEAETPTRRTVSFVRRTLRTLNCAYHTKTLRRTCRHAQTTVPHATSHSRVPFSRNCIVAGVEMLRLSQSRSADSPYSPPDVSLCRPPCFHFRTGLGRAYTPNF